MVDLTHRGTTVGEAATSALLYYNRALPAYFL